MVSVDGSASHRRSPDAAFYTVVFIERRMESRDIRFLHQLIQRTKIALVPRAARGGSHGNVQMPSTSSTVCLAGFRRPTRRQSYSAIA